MSIWHKHSDDLRKQTVDIVIENHRLKEIERLKPKHEKATNRK